MFKYKTHGCCSGFHGNFSVKAWKRFDLCTQTSVATMAVCYANIMVDIFDISLKTLVFTSKMKTTQGVTIKTNSHLNYNIVKQILMENECLPL